MTKRKKYCFFSLLSFLVYVALTCISGGSALAEDNSTFECGRNLFNSKMYKDALRYFKAAEKEASFDDRSFYYEALCYHRMGQLQAALTAYQSVISKFPDSDAADQSKKAVASMSKGYSAEKSGGTVGHPATMRMDQIPLEASIAAKEIDGKPEVEALVSGVKVKFIVDTTSADTVIGADIARENKIPDVTAFKKDKEANYCLYEIKLGSMVRTSFPVRISTKLPKSAVLGADFFASTSSAFDAKTNLLSIKRLPGFTNTFENGLKLFTKNRFAAAYPLLKKAAVDRPTDPRALYTLAICAHRLGKMDEARADYHQVLKRFPGSEAETYATAALESLDPGFASRNRLAQAAKTGQLLGPALKQSKGMFEVPYVAEYGSFRINALVDNQNMEVYFSPYAPMHIFSTEQLRRLDPSYLDTLSGDFPPEPLDPDNSNNLTRVVTRTFKIRRIKLGKIEAQNTSAKTIDSVTRFGAFNQTSPFPILAGTEMLKNWRWEAIPSRRVLRFTQTQ